jgi:hypothetical protein
MKKKITCWHAKIYNQNKSSVHEIVKKEQEIFSGFAVTLQLQKVTAAVHDVCWVKVVKTLNLRIYLQEKP